MLADMVGRGVWIHITYPAEGAFRGIGASLRSRRDGEDDGDKQESVDYNLVGLHGEDDRC